MKSPPIKPWYLILSNFRFLTGAGLAQLLFFLALSSVLLSLRIHPADSGRLWLYVWVSLYFSVILFCLLGLGNLEFRVSNYGAACLTLLFIYVMWALLSAMLSDYPSESVKRVLTILLSSLFFSLICQSMKPSDIFEGGKRVLLLFVIFVSALVLISVVLNFIGSLYYDPEIGFVQELSLLGFKVGQEVSGDHFLPRYFSLTPNPNTFSGFVFVSIVSCFYLRKIGYIGKALHFLLLLMLVLGLLMAQSKASIIASILGVIVFGFMVSGRKLEFVLGSIISVLVVSVISMLLFVSDFQGAGFLDDNRLASGLSGRDELWGFAVSIFNDNLIFGGGYGVSDLLLARYGSWNLSSHNALLSIMMETGIVGLVIFICMVTFSLVVNIHLWAKLRNTDLGIYYVFLVSMIISILAYQMVESSLFKLAFMNYAFLYFVFSGLRASD